MLLHHTLIRILVLVGAGVAPGVGQAAEPVGESVVIDSLHQDVQARDWRWIVLHHSATAGGSVASIDAVHRRNTDSTGSPWLGIGYHFVVGNGRGMKDGEVQATFRWQRQLAGAHAGRDAYNQHGIGICLVGDFEQIPPSERQLAALKSLLETLVSRYAIAAKHVVRHQDVRDTLCPGRNFPWNQLVAELGASGTRADITARDKGS